MIGDARVAIAPKCAQARAMAGLFGDILRTLILNAAGAHAQA